MHMLGPSDCLSCTALLRQKKLSGLVDLPLDTAMIKNHTVFTPAANANIPTRRSFTLLIVRGKSGSDQGRENYYATDAVSLRDTWLI
jgi:hypothetical protein